MSKVAAQALLGTWRRFGAVGPAYQVIAIGGSTPDGADRIVRIRLAETGEELDYTLNRAADDEIVAEAAR